MERNKSGHEEKDAKELALRRIKLWARGAFIQFSILFAVFLLLWIVAGTIFLNSTAPVSWDLSEESEVLEPTGDLNILPGERYEYLVLAGGQRQYVSLRAKQVNSCPGIVLEDAKNQFQLCILRSGFYSNSSQYLGSSSFPFYVPWMLYLHDGFFWRFNRTMTVYPPNITERAGFLFEVLNTTSIFGRDAYEVHSSQLSGSPFFVSGSPSNSVYFVDVEKRVLLKAQSGSAEIRIVSAPFELEDAGSD